MTPATETPTDTISQAASVATSAARRASRRPRHRLATTVRATVLTLVLLAVGIVWVYPFIWMVSASLKSNTEIFSGLNPFPHVIHLDNYVRAWTDAQIGQDFLNTVLITTGSIVISVTATAMIGYVLGRYRFRGKRLLIALFAASIFLPEGYTIIPIFDLINRIHLNDSRWGVTLAEAGGAHVVAILLFMGYFRQLPGELEEAARVDGAGFFRIFARIYLPLAKPVIATAVILQFMQSWNDFLLPLVLTLSRPQLRTLAVGIYSMQGDHFNDWGALTAASTIALLPIIIVFLLLQRYFVESMAGAIKG
jgi:ABC-type glycerol-3-phosphate transport system permease component